MRRRYPLTLAAAAALALPLAVTPAWGHGKRTFTSQSTQPFEYIGTNPGGVPRADLCDPDFSRCILGFIGHERMSGALDGVMNEAATVTFQPATGIGEAVGYGTFTGAVAGCPGPGTVTFRQFTHLATATGQNSGEFEVVQGSGSGGLATLRGTGRFVSKPDPATGTFTASGTVKLRCG
jgi:hypothetical protein